MKNLLIAGAGPHCKVVLDIISSAGEWTPVGILDAGRQESVLGVPVIGDDAKAVELFDKGVRYAFVAIGNNAIRKKVSENLIEMGYSMAAIISPSAIVSPYAVIGAGTVVMPGAVINVDASVGEGCIINTNSSIDHDCQIGPYVHIAPGCAVSGSTRIGAQTFLGTRAGAIDGITIGSQVMIGAGAIVVNDIPNCCTALGVPARVVKERDQ